MAVQTLLFHLMRRSTYDMVKIIQSRFLGWNWHMLLSIPLFSAVFVHL